MEGPCCNQYTNDGTEPMTVEEFNQLKEQENEKLKKVLKFSISIFKGEDDDDVDICPYSDRPCHNGFDCADCTIEAEEQAWLEEDDDE